MSEILHIIGLCPDGVSHPNIIDLILCSYSELQTLTFQIKFKIAQLFKLI